MSANFYLIGQTGNSDPQYHLGKLETIGLYCKACDIYFHDRTDCPVCQRQSEDPAITVCDRFVWSMTWASLVNNIANLTGDVICDQNGRMYTASQFIDIVDNCIFVDYSRVGQIFN